MNKHVLKPILVLFILCFTVAAAVSITNYFTADKVAAQDAAKVTDNIALLLPGTTENVKTECDAFTYYECTGSDAAALGRVYLINARGYGGPISLMVGIKPDGTVAGISIVSSSETPGMGKKAENPDFYGQFSNKNVDMFTVIKGEAKTDDQISAISGATITSRAITDAVNTVLTHFNGGGK